jgi:Type II secretion system protein B
VSYILDALKKAAEQRDAHAPAIRRLFSPAPEMADSPHWRLAVVGGAVAVAGAVIAVWALWPVSSSVLTEPPVAPTATARVQPEAPPAVPPPPPAPPVVRTAPKPAPVRAAAEKRPAPTPAVQTRQAPVESVPARPQPTTPPPVIAAVRPAPVPTVAAPPASVQPRADVSGQMRLEVIVYSEERARRLAFINGRKYVEGDVLLDGARVQEIQPNAVVIIDDGRRVILRP